MNGSWGPSLIPVRRYRFSKKEGVQLTLQYQKVVQQSYSPLNID
uniref:Uncharacterized protein n=1 Tax=Arundo donax TaxID=35708 RepID=A0A0A9DGR4_ARUDO